MSLLCLLTTALAGEVQVWNYTDFPSQQALGGYDGWTNGYNQDTWQGYQGRDGTKYAITLTDDYEQQDCDGGWTRSCMNYLEHPAEDVTQGRYAAQVYTQDDDTFGLVFGFKSDNDYLLFLLCGAAADSSCPLASVGAGKAALVQVTKGQATVLATSAGGFDQNVIVDLDVTVNNGKIRAALGNVKVNADMPDDRKMNGVGFYAYNAGAADGSYLFFTNPTLFAMDDDDDGVIDDEDNCENDANPDQTDQDGDGKGAACDENDAKGGGGTDTGTTDDTAIDTGPGSDGDTGGDPVDKIGIAGGCACNSTPGTSGVLGGMLLGALALVRRRR